MNSALKQCFATAIIAFSLIIEISGQIQNAGFENWTILQGYEKPDFWITNQSNQLIRFEKDTALVEGMYSLKAIPSTTTAWQDCMSIAEAGVKFASTGQNKKLEFYVKCVSDTSSLHDTVFLRIAGQLFENGIWKSNYEWETYEEILQMKKVEIPLNNPSIDSLTIKIFAGALNGPADGCLYRSVSWVDGFQVTNSGQPSPIVNPFVSTPKIYPNPAKGFINIENYQGIYDAYALYSINGDFIRQGVLKTNRSRIRINLKGIFTLVLTDKTGKAGYNQKIILR